VVVVVERQRAKKRKKGIEKEGNDCVVCVCSWRKRFGVCHHASAARGCQTLDLVVGLCFMGMLPDTYLLYYERDS